MPWKADLRLSEVIAALSYALDLADGQALGHAVRSCMIGMRLADELGLEVDDREALFYGLLLKDAGCSSNAARITALYGADDLAAKRNARLVSHSRGSESLGYVVRNAAGLRGVVRVLRARKATAREMTAIRCERGAEIARMLGLPEATSAAIYSLDEHWDGKGHPRGLAHEEIPLLARILCVAQTVEVFLARESLDAACLIAVQRSDTWFDPAVVCALLSIYGDTEFWETVSSGRVRQHVAALAPAEGPLAAGDERGDRVAEAFARVVDAKSPYTFRHSERVAEIAVSIAVELGFDPVALRDLRRAGLLHDIGKLGVSNLILDKPGPLSAAEMGDVRRHPALTKRILEPVAVLGGIAADAAAHHERLDGSGYPDGLTAGELSPAARALAVADVYEALTSERPHRAALPVDAALALMHEEPLCPVALAALEASLGRRALPVAA